MDGFLSSRPATATQQALSQTKDKQATQANKSSPDQPSQSRCLPYNPAEVKRPCSYRLSSPGVGVREGEYKDPCSLRGGGGGAVGHIVKMSLGDRDRVVKIFAK